MKKKHIQELNITRGILCVLVILIHTISVPESDLVRGSFAYTMVDFIWKSTTIVVPGFIILSGFSLYYRYENEELNVTNFYKERLPKIFIPYLGWSVIYTVFYYIIYSKEVSLILFLKELLTGSAAYHLYFMVILLKLYIVFPLLKKLYDKLRNRSLHITLILILINILSFLEIEKIDEYRLMLKYIGFFAFGMYLASNYKSIKRTLEKNEFKILILSFIFSIYNYIIYSYKETYNIVVQLDKINWIVFCIIGILALLTLSIRIENSFKKTSKYFKMISRYSFFIYLSHPLILALIQENITKDSSSIIDITVSTIALIGIYSIYIYTRGTIKNKEV